MLRRTLTNYHRAGIVAALLAAVALALGSLWLYGAVVAAFLAVVGLGAAIPQLSLFGPYVCRGNALQRCVALTFDDGPDARSTPALLDLLRATRIQAAFFCVGKRVEAQPELASRIVNDGHLLENHTYMHSNRTNLLSAEKLQTELARAQTAIQNATGTIPALFRPPMGLSNPKTFQAARALGLKVIGWSARGLDTRITEPERIVARIERRLKPGAIILLHDGNIPPERLLATVKLLLERLRALEYEVVRLDRMLS